jgi:hypothetical protein
MTRDELIGVVAEAMHAVEYGGYNPDATNDANRPTWPFELDSVRVTWRLYAAAALDALVDSGVEL